MGTNDRTILGVHLVVQRRAKILHARARAIKRDDLNGTTFANMIVSWFYRGVLLPSLSFSLSLSDSRKLNKEWQMRVSVMFFSRGSARTTRSSRLLCDRTTRKRISLLRRYTECPRFNGALLTNLILSLCVRMRIFINQFDCAV